MFSVLLLAATAAASPACQKLQYEFVQDEYRWAANHDLDQRLLDIAEELDRKMANNRVVNERRAALLATDTEYREKLNTIITLLVANKCIPPDRAPTWFTYSDKNPNRVMPDREKIKPKQ